VKAVIHYENAKVPWRAAATPISAFIFNNPVRYVVIRWQRRRHRPAYRRGRAQLIEVKLKKFRTCSIRTKLMKPDARRSLRTDLSVGKGAFSAHEESWGDLETDSKEADRVFEDTYISKHVNNTQLERRVASPNGCGEIDRVCVNPRRFQRAHGHAKDFGLPLSKVRIVCKYMGGASATKTKLQDTTYMAVVLASHAQPVSLITREDDTSACTVAGLPSNTTRSA